MQVNGYSNPELGTHIIEKAKALGASLAGIAHVDALPNTSSYKIDETIVKWPQKAKSLLVLALAHEISRPELDWWDNRKGGSPGNRLLERLANSLRLWLKEELKLPARLLPYHIEKGGVFLKDAAVLAGLGTVGKNNLLITPQFGPHVRLRALLVGGDLEAAGTLAFSPCHACTMPCRAACPQNAFENDSYSRARCMVQMREDEKKRKILPGTGHDSGSIMCTTYCRACEMACPVAV